MPTSTPQSVVMTTAKTSKLPTIGGKYFALAAEIMKLQAIDARVAMR